MSDSVSIKVYGYSGHSNGYSGAFSWWRNHSDLRYWSVLGHEEGFTLDVSAVVDDFGNLAAVSRGA